jgi:hypothetical protein
MTLSKTDYILYRECPQNVWFKVHRPDVYFASELSEFEKTIIETGNEVELVARELFPKAFLIEGRDAQAEKITQERIADKESVLFQPVFSNDNFMAALDVLELNEDGTYTIYEIKATNAVDKKTHYHDLAFQVNLVESFGLKISKANVIHLNPGYVRAGELDIHKLFTITDVTEEIKSLKTDVASEANKALEYISQTEEPNGYCCCLYKGRSNHCTTFRHFNPDVPEYGVHDISRIGSSKAKLKELIDNNILHIKDIPPHMKLSDIQQSQVDAHVLDRVTIKKSEIAEEFGNLVFPLYFLDYETFPSAIPRFDGFSSFNQIPFQYSLHVLESATSEPKHFDFLDTNSGDPSKAFAESLKQNLGDKGSIIVWHKSFECGRNTEIGERLPEFKSFMDSVNDRIYDLEEIFKKQYHIHKDFRGGTSIKRILPVLVPDLKYDDLEIHEGGSAADAWNKIVSGAFTKEEQDKVITNLKTYCGLDSYAMYAIWKHLFSEIS